MPEPPAHISMPPEALPFWHSIVRARDYTSWTEIDLEHAANLACCQCDLNRLREEVRIEGDVIQNQRGTPIMNPKHSLIEVLSRRAVALSRLLQVHAQATVGESRDASRRLKNQREVEAHKAALEDDALIARPTH